MSPVPLNISVLSIEQDFKPLSCQADINHVGGWDSPSCSVAETAKKQCKYLADALAANQRTTTERTTNGGEDDSTGLRSNKVCAFWPYMARAKTYIIGTQYHELECKTLALLYTHFIMKR